jgi:hypothetical protein
MAADQNDVHLTGIIAGSAKPGLDLPLSKLSNPREVCEICSESPTELRPPFAGTPLCGSAGRRRKTTKPAFVGLITPKLTKLHEFVIEIESLHGPKMCIHWKAAAPPDWTALLRAWREVEG